MQLRVDSEYDRLEAVLVHRPGAEIQRLTHENMHALLFEDIPYLRRMQDEHDAFVAEMRAAGIEVVYLEDLLLDLLRDPAQRREIVQHVARSAGVPAITADLESEKCWPAQRLLEVLFAGLTADEFFEATGRRIARAPSRMPEHNPACSDGFEFLLDPIPNAYFARDPAVVVRDAVIACKMHYPQRIRESLLTRFVFERHPDFTDHVLAYGGTAEPTEDRPYTIEGGDVILLSPEAVLIGDSERTRGETIELIAAKCFQHTSVQRVYEVPIPTERTFMHLDTVFNILDRGLVLWFGPVMENLAYIHRYERDVVDQRRARRVPEERSIRAILAAEFGTEVTIIETAGGRRHFAAREQRTDGANAFSIAPRTAIVYERNEFTIHALEQHGVRCVRINDAELVRGLGGPRCMTMPLRRG